MPVLTRSSQGCSLLPQGGAGLGRGARARGRGGGGTRNSNTGIKYAAIPLVKKSLAFLLSPISIGTMRTRVVLNV